MLLGFPGKLKKHHKLLHVLTGFPVSIPDASRSPAWCLAVPEAAGWQEPEGTRGMELAAGVTPPPQATDPAVWQLCWVCEALATCLPGAWGRQSRARLAQLAPAAHQQNQRSPRQGPQRPCCCGQGRGGRLRDGPGWLRLARDSPCPTGRKMVQQHRTATPRRSAAACGGAPGTAPRVHAPTHPPQPHVCVHPRTHTHPRMHPRTHTRQNIHAPRRSHTPPPTRACTHVLTHTPTHACTHALTHTHTCMHPCTRTCMHPHTRIHSHVHAPTHSHVNIPMHSHMCAHRTCCPLGWQPCWDFVPHPRGLWGLGGVGDLLVHSPGLEPAWQPVPLTGPSAALTHVSFRHPTPAPCPGGGARLQPGLCTAEGCGERGEAGELQRAEMTTPESSTHPPPGTFTHGTSHAAPTHSQLGHSDLHFPKIFRQGWGKRFLSPTQELVSQK